MIYFIDFDCTLYDTEMLINAIIEDLTNHLSKYAEREEVLKYLVYEFKEKRVASIFEFCKSCAQKYGEKEETIVNLIKNVASDGKRFVYDDSINFLRSINHHKRIMLTYSTKEGTDYQKLKIEGSGLAEFFDEIIITNNNKGDLDIDYGSGIFIDDSPKAIVDIHSKSPLKIIRVNRPNSTYSKITLPENVIVPEVSALLQINVNQEV